MVRRQGHVRLEVLGDEPSADGYYSDWGHFEQIGPLLRCGPVTGGPRMMLPGIGEHTVEILAELGFSAEQIDALLAAKVARQLGD